MMKLNLISILVLFPLISVWGQQSLKPWLGVSIEKGSQGVLVKQALPDTPAIKAGIESGDEILKVDQSVVKIPDELIQQVANKGVGHTVEIEILRNNKKLSKKITLVARPDMVELVNKALLNKPAPEFEAVVVKGSDQKKFNSQAFRDKITVLEFWATWCPACVSSFPRLTEFAQKHKGRIQVVTISGEEVPVIKKFLDKAPVPNLKDSPIIYLQSPKGEVGGKYFTSGIPMFLLIDKKGVVRQIAVGAGMYLDSLLSAAEKL